MSEHDERIEVTAELAEALDKSIVAIGRTEVYDSHERVMNAWLAIVGGARADVPEGPALCASCGAPENWRVLRDRDEKPPSPPLPGGQVAG